MEEEEGTETGMCPFVVHGLTGEEYSTKSIKAIKAIALKHLKDNRNRVEHGSRTGLMTSHRTRPGTGSNDPRSSQVLTRPAGFSNTAGLWVHDGVGGTDWITLRAPKVLTHKGEGDSVHKTQCTYKGGVSRRTVCIVLEEKGPTRPLLSHQRQPTERRPSSASLT